MLDSAVELAQPGVGGKVRREFRHYFDKFIRRETAIHVANGLVVYILNRVAIRGEHFFNLWCAGHGAAMRWHEVVGVKLAQLVDALEPFHRVSMLGAA